MKKLIILLFSFVVLISCKDDDHVGPTDPQATQPQATPATGNSLADLPKDTGGQLVPNVLGSDNSPYGYYLYKPSGYTPTGPRFPLLIFLHGSGEIGNSGARVTALDSVLSLGPPMLIQTGKWNPKYPMIVASPQSTELWWDPIQLTAFIEFMATTYRVDASRIYITGLSMGGTGIYDLITIKGSAAHIAAAVPIVSGGTLTDDGVKKAAGIPLWAFHGKDDLIISPDFDIAMNKAINATNPPVRAKLTMYAGQEHHVWAETYDGTGMGKEDPSYDPFNMEIYTWMLQYSATY